MCVYCVVICLCGICGNRWNEQGEVLDFSGFSHNAFRVFVINTGFSGVFTIFGVCGIFGNFRWFFLINSRPAFPPHQQLHFLGSLSDPVVPGWTPPRFCMCCLDCTPVSAAFRSRLEKGKLIFENPKCRKKSEFKFNFFIYFFWWIAKMKNSIKFQKF